MFEFRIFKYFVEKTETHPFCALPFAGFPPAIPLILQLLTPTNIIFKS